MAKVKKAIITAAGFGTRFLPITKDVQKEMLPVIDKPIIQYVVEEIIEAGIEDIVIVIKPGGESIMNYFTDDPKLEKFLEENNKLHLLDSFRGITSKANFIFMHQNQNLPYGNGSPVLTAKALLKDGPFLFCFGDDFVITPNLPSGAKQVVDDFESRDECYGIVAVQEVPKEEVSRYGIVEYDPNQNNRITRLVEKPKPEETNSNLAEFGRIVLTPEVFEFLKADRVGKHGELWLVDAINEVIQQKPLYPKHLQGQWVTTGDPLRYLRATIEIALLRNDLRDDIISFMREKLDSIQ